MRKNQRVGQPCKKYVPLAKSYQNPQRNLSECFSNTLLELLLEDHRNIPIKFWEHKNNRKIS
jgi:hypothetical protein